MGIPGFNVWFAGEHKNAYVPLGKVRVDHLYIDLNSVLHNVMRKAKNHNHFHKLLHKRLHGILDATCPTKSVMLAVDGPAPLAKLLTQRDRRKKTGRSLDDGETLTGVAITPGTTFMLDLTHSLTYYCCVKMSSRRFRHLAFELSDGTVMGEGEVKVLGRLARQWYHADPNDTHVILGDDADLILMALTSYKGPRPSFLPPAANDSGSNDSWPGSKAPADPRAYLRGCVWLLQMYLTGQCPDYRFFYDGMAPTAAALRAACEASIAAGHRHIRLETLGPNDPRATQPLLPVACALALLPANCAHLAAPCVRHLMGGAGDSGGGSPPPGGSEAVGGAVGTTAVGGGGFEQDLYEALYGDCRECRSISAEVTKGQRPPAVGPGAAAGVGGLAAAGAADGAGGGGGVAAVAVAMAAATATAEVGGGGIQGPAAEAQRKRGRPRGSKNRTKAEAGGAAGVDGGAAAVAVVAAAVGPSTSGGEGLAAAALVYGSGGASASGVPPPMPSSRLLMTAAQGGARTAAGPPGAPYGMQSYNGVPSYGNTYGGAVAAPPPQQHPHAQAYQYQQHQQQQHYQPYYPAQAPQPPQLYAGYGEAVQQLHHNSTPYGAPRPVQAPLPYGHSNPAPPPVAAAMYGVRPPYRPPSPTAVAAAAAAAQGRVRPSGMQGPRWP
ncbi:5'-3' exoribonuclease 1 [Tetrabaena socialis]|uniref:5'-3' exoribonuclease 1 n=1 Tax=Tetrabaena socialis TaxID=47790 RepID=A0A2J8A1E8_9CHLO|nr:5'-3' exoribonuclease 1 [Tetrabaena socialis]|eukprot:PNH06347.1 5'-3' exoribonuclease 1 [Tetrabaena socialis]